MASFRTDRRAHALSSRLPRLLLGLLIGLVTFSASTASAGVILNADLSGSMQASGDRPISPEKPPADAIRSLAEIPVGHTHGMGSTPSAPTGSPVSTALLFGGVEVPELQLTARLALSRHLLLSLMCPMDLLRPPQARLAVA
jgi:hypothetical protein